MDLFTTNSCVHVFDFFDHEFLTQASSKNSNLSELFPSVLTADGFKPDADGGLSEALSKALNISVAENIEPAVIADNKGGKFIDFDIATNRHCGK